MQKQPVSFGACKHQLLALLHCSLRHQSQKGLFSSLLVVEICLRLPEFNLFFIMIIVSSSTLSLKSPIQERACHEAKHLIPAQALRVVVRDKVALRLNLDQIVGALRWAAKLVHKDSANTSAYQPCMGSVLVILVTVLHVPCESCASFRSDLTQQVLSSICIPILAEGWTREENSPWLNNQWKGTSTCLTKST